MSWWRQHELVRAAGARPLPDTAQPALLKPFRHSATPLRAKRDGGPTTGLRCAASGELRRAADDRVLACIDGIERAAGGRWEEAAGTPARLPVCCSSISGSQHRHRRPLRPFVLAGTLVSFVLATGRGTRIVTGTGGGARAETRRAGGRLVPAPAPTRAVSCALLRRRPEAPLPPSNSRWAAPCAAVAAQDAALLFCTLSS